MDQQHDELNLTGNREPFFSIEPGRRRAFSIWFLVVLVVFVLGYCVFVLHDSDDLSRSVTYPGSWWFKIIWDWNTVRILLFHLGGDFFYIVLSAFVFTFVIHEGVPVSVHIVSCMLAPIQKLFEKLDEYVEKARRKEIQQAERIATLEETIENLQEQLERRRSSTETLRSAILFRVIFDRESRLWSWRGEDALGGPVITLGYHENKVDCIREIRQYMKTEGISERTPVYDENGRRIHF